MKHFLTSCFNPFPEFLFGTQLHATAGALEMSLGAANDASLVGIAIIL